MGDPFVRPGLQYQPHIEQILLKNEGTMTLSTSKNEWLKSQHRDTLASIILQPDQLQYLALVQNVPPAQLKRVLLERLVDPLHKDLPLHFTSALVTSLHIQHRWLTRVPNNGYHKSASIPDRYKDICASWGVQHPEIDGDKDPPFIPREKRETVVTNMLNDRQNMLSFRKFDRVRTALDAVYSRQFAGDAPWHEVYQSLRTTYMCCQLCRCDHDVFPPGHKLWIELDICEQRRIPMLLELPNGILVLPVFSMQYYLDQYFSRVPCFESVWFPIPRGGSQRQQYNKLPFPVCGMGKLRHVSTLATIAYPQYQFAILLNASETSSKFITYPQMVTLAEQQLKADKEAKPQTASNALSSKLNMIDSSILSSFSSSQSFSSSSSSSSTSAGKNKTQNKHKHFEQLHTSYDVNLLSVFNTVKMPLKRVEPHEVQQKMSQRPGLPPVAQMELHLLMYPYEAISHIYIRLMPRPRWRTMWGGSEQVAQIDVVCFKDTKPPADFAEHLQRWSYIKQFGCDVHIELTRTIPTQPIESATKNTFCKSDTCMCVYTADDGAWLRSLCPEKTQTLAEKLSFNEPLTDEHGMKPYEYKKPFID